MQNAAPWSHQNWAISKGSHNTYSVLLSAFSHKLAPVIWKLLAVSLHAAIDLLSQINCTCTAASHSHSMSRGILCWSWTLQTGVHCLNPSYATEQLQCSFQFWFLDNLNILHYSDTVHTSTLNPLETQNFHISLTINNSLDCVKWGPSFKRYKINGYLQEHTDILLQLLLEVTYSIILMTFEMKAQRSCCIRYQKAKKPADSR